MDSILTLLVNAVIKYVKSHPGAIDSLVEKGLDYVLSELNKPTTR